MKALVVGLALLGAGCEARSRVALRLLAPQDADSEIERLLELCGLAEEATFDRISRTYFVRFSGSLPERRQRLIRRALTRIAAARRSAPRRLDDPRRPPPRKELPLFVEITDLGGQELARSAGKPRARLRFDIDRAGVQQRSACRYAIPLTQPLPAAFERQLERARAHRIVADESAFQRTAERAELLGTGDEAAIGPSAVHGVAFVFAASDARPGRCGQAVLEQADLGFYRAALFPTLSRLTRDFDISSELH